MIAKYEESDPQKTICDKLLGIVGQSLGINSTEYRSLDLEKNPKGIRVWDVWAVWECRDGPGASPFKVLKTSLQLLVFKTTNSN